MARPSSARQGQYGDLLVFAAILGVLSAVFELNIVRNGLTPERYVPLVYVPALAAVVAQGASGARFAAGSFGLTGRALRGVLLGLLYPLLVAVPAYGIAWLAGVVRFVPAATYPLGFPIPGDTTTTRLLAHAAISITIAPLVMGILAIGEEIGWRGYLLPRLIAARVPRPVLVTNLVWSLWHAPLLLSQRYLPSPYPVLSLGLFCVSLGGMGWVAAYLRLTTGSIWPAVALHAAWNAILVLFFNVYTQGELAPLWVGEGGILVASCVAVSALVWWRCAPVSDAGSARDALPVHDDTHTGGHHGSAAANQRA